jgi:hypothetical protein
VEGEPIPGTPLPESAVLGLRAQVEGYLDRIAFTTEPLARPLAEVMRYSLLAGGPRVRPLIAMSTAEALGRDPASVLPLAAGLEMIYTHALMHDELRATSDERAATSDEPPAGDDARVGRLTAHAVYGENVALLAGDALMAEAIALVLREQRGEPERVLAAVAELTTTVVDGTSSRHLGAPVLTVLALTGASGPVAAALAHFAARLAGASRATLAERPGDPAALRAVTDLRHAGRAMTAPDHGYGDADDDDGSPAGEP